MSRIYLRQISLRKWFPPHDRFAACVARLCILREDFALEMWGLYALRMGRMDAHSVAWRRLYFWRNLVRTLWEIRKAIESLNTVPEFRAVFKAQTLRERQKFEVMTRKLEKAQTLVQTTRNSLGGHVLERTVQEALNNMPLGQFGYLEVGGTLKKTHYKFAGEIVAQMLVAGVPESKQQAEAERHFRTIAGLLPVYAMTDTILRWYVDARNLID